MTYQQRFGKPNLANIESEWSDWFLSEIEGHTVRAGSVVIWAIGGAGFVLRTNEATIYIDPYFGTSVSAMGILFFRMIPIPMNPEQIRMVDAVVSTHDDQDHCDENTIIPLSVNTQAAFIGPSSSAELISSWGVSRDRIIKMNDYQSTQVKNIKITALPSADTYPKAASTYMFEAGGVAVFHSGDSPYFDKFREFGLTYSVDIALLNLAKNPPGMTQFMNPREVLKAARELGARFLVPMHWDLWKICLEDPHLVESIARKEKLDIQVVILRLGDRFEYP